MACDQIDTPQKPNSVENKNLSDERLMKDIKAQDRLDYLVRTKEPSVKQVAVNQKEVDKDGFLRMMAYVSHHIEQDLKSGIFLPLGRMSFTRDCQRCGYKEICDQEI